MQQMPISIAFSLVRHRINIVALNCHGHHTELDSVAAQLTIIYYIPSVLIQAQEKKKKILAQVSDFSPWDRVSRSSVCLGFLEKKSWSSCLYPVPER